MRDEESSNTVIGRIMLFNGPPSTGKTNLVNALQHDFAEPWFHLSLDDFRSGFSERWWLGDDGQLFGRLISGYLGLLLQMALAGNDVLAEAVITPERRYLYQSPFGETPIVLIGVICPLEVAIQRESCRTDRRHGPIELPVNSFAAVHAGLSYDIEVATETGNPKELATNLIPQLDRLLPSSFKNHLT